MNIKIIKKDGTKVDYDPQKIITAVGKSAARVMITLSDEEKQKIIKKVEDYINSCNCEEITIAVMHNIVEAALEAINYSVARSYKEYRNYKTDFVGILDEVYNKAQSIMYLGDKENSNSDSALVSTKRSLIYSELNRELYNKFFLTAEERQACRDGYIYIHDKAARRDSINCCLFDAKSVMENGFEMGNMWYNEPKTIDTACDVFADIILMSAAMQYGGWSTRADNLLNKYCEKSFYLYKEEYLNESCYLMQKNTMTKAQLNELSENYAFKKTKKDLEQGIQGIEYKLNSVASSRGDYPFVTIAIGLDDSFWGQEVSKAFLRVRKQGQGKDGFKRPVLFPKLVFLYDKDLHGDGCPLEDVYNEAIECSAVAMYPDYLSLTGEGYVAEMYKKHKQVVYPMG